jgi:hypothetical protein
VWRDDDEREIDHAQERRARGATRQDAVEVGCVDEQDVARHLRDSDDEQLARIRGAFERLLHAARARVHALQDETRERRFARQSFEEDGVQRADQTPRRAAGRHGWREGAPGKRVEQGRFPGVVRPDDSHDQVLARASRSRKEIVLQSLDRLARERLHGSVHARPTRGERFEQGMDAPQALGEFGHVEDRERRSALPRASWGKAGRDSARMTEECLAFQAEGIFLCVSDAKEALRRGDHAGLKRHLARDPKLAKGEPSWMRRDERIGARWSSSWSTART